MKTQHNTARERKKEWHLHFSSSRHLAPFSSSNSNISLTHTHIFSHTYIHSVVCLLKKREPKTPAM